MKIWERKEKEDKVGGIGWEEGRKGEREEEEAILIFLFHRHTQ